MSYYDQPIEAQTLTIRADEDAGFSGVSISDDRPGQFRVYWRYVPATGAGGISGISWPEDLVGISDLLANLNVNDPESIDAVSAAVYNYTTNILQNESGEVWEAFRDTYMASCISW